MKNLSKSKYTTYCQCPKALWLRIYKPEEQIIDPSYGWICENNQEALNIAYVEAIKDIDRLHKMKEDLKSYHYPNEKILKEFEEVL